MASSGRWQGVNFVWSAHVQLRSLPEGGHRERWAEKMIATDDVLAPNRLLLAEAKHWQRQGSPPLDGRHLRYELVYFKWPIASGNCDGLR